MNGLKVLMLVGLTFSLGCMGLFREPGEPTLTDKDGDGVGFIRDCANQNPNRSPKLAEICDDRGVDEDCDGKADLEDDDFADHAWYTDLDNDGFGDPETAVRACRAPSPFEVNKGGDCDDRNSTIYPGADDPEGDGEDQDCDGEDGSASDAPGGDSSWPGDSAFDSGLAQPEFREDSLTP